MASKDQYVLACIISSYLKESGMQWSLCDVKHLRAVNTTIVIDLLDDESVGEGRDVQHVEECGLAGTNLVTSLDQINISLTWKIYCFNKDR